MNTIKAIALYLARLFALTFFISMFVGPVVFSGPVIVIVSDLAIWLSICCGDEGTLHFAADLMCLISVLLAVLVMTIINRLRRSEKVRAVCGG